MASVTITKLKGFIFLFLAQTIHSAVHLGALFRKILKSYQISCKLQSFIFSFLAQTIHLSVYSGALLRKSYQIQYALKQTYEEK